MGMKILLAPFGSRGDVHPMIALAERLDREGHEVLIAGPPDYVAAAERRRRRYHGYGRIYRKVPRRETPPPIMPAARAVPTAR